MNKNMSLNEFHKDFYEQVNLTKETETYGWEPEDFFTAVMLDYLEEAGEVENSIVCPFRDRGLQLNAYSITEDNENVDIFVSIFLDSEEPQNVTRNDIDASLKRAIQLYRKSINDLFASFERDNDTYEFAITMNKIKKSIK